MTDEQQDAATDAAEAEGEQPTPEFSQSSDEQSSAPEVDLDALADKVADRIGGDLRRAQSFKDQFEAASDQLGDLSRVTEFLEVLDDFDGNRDEALREMRIRALEQQSGQTREQPEPGADIGGAMTAEELEAEVSDILESAGISGEDARSVREEWAQNDYELSPTGYRKAFKDLTAIATRSGREVSKREQPAGKATAMSGGAATGQASGMTDEQLMESIWEHQHAKPRDVEGRQPMLDEARERGLMD